MTRKPSKKNRKPVQVHSPTKSGLGRDAAGARIVSTMDARPGPRKKILDELWCIGKEDARFPQDQVLAALSLLRSNELLRAYQIDRNPDHIFSAWIEFDDMRVLPPETMFRALRRAIDERKKKPKTKLKSTTLRDVRFLTRLVKNGDFPDRVDSTVVSELANHYEMSAASVRKAIARLRADWGDSSGYHRPRAYRDK